MRRIRACTALAVLSVASSACGKKAVDASPSPPPALGDAGSAQVSPDAIACEALPALALPHVTITEARAIAAAGSSTGAPAMPAYCRVLGVSRPTPDSEIRFEVAIPAGTAWNGRYEQAGNGGFAGQIPEDDILLAVAAGSAAAGTDDGHVSTRGTDASWALGHPEKLVDYGYRALKETSDAARAILHAHTGRAPTHSYFIGCSDGGREALMEARRYPDDCDGIVAGAPANYATHLLVAMAWNVRALRETPASAIPASKLRAIEAAALDACGQEGVVENPLACRFDPAVLRCTGADSDRCLTDPQLTALRKIYSGAKNPRTGAPIEPGFEPGAEAEQGSWADWIVGPAPAAANRAVQVLFSESFFRFMVFGDPKYDLARLDFDRDVSTAEAKVASIIDSINPDLGAFEKHGGKLIQFHGWADPVIPPRDSIAYHDAVQAKMGDTSSFYRLFLAPGMLHCDGGPGPNMLATREAITAWVERGTAPDRLMATKRPGDDPSKPAVSTRPLCPHPQVARWDGKTDRNRAEGYTCGAPAAHP
jgi:Tannase and feruloyl esterase